MNLSKSELNIITKIIEWSKRMKSKHGTIILDSKNIKHDWGQGLCRTLFGHNWEDYMKNNNILIPTEDHLETALDWENGNTPDWISKYE